MLQMILMKVIMNSLMHLIFKNIEYQLLSLGIVLKNEREKILKILVIKGL